MLLGISTTSAERAWDFPINHEANVGLGAMQAQGLAHTGRLSTSAGRRCR
jgi:hypothetical protein